MNDGIIIGEADEGVAAGEPLNVSGVLGRIPVGAHVAENQGSGEGVFENLRPLTVPFVGQEDDAVVEQLVTVIRAAPGRGAADTGDARHRVL